jgi:hypothetical protein
MLSHSSYFDRIVESTILIARHPDYPGKQWVVAQCADEIEELRDAGKISKAEGELLLEILRGDHGRVAWHHRWVREEAAQLG